MSKTDEHNILIDIARIIGALAVVAIHVTDGLVNLPNHFGGVSWWWANFINTSSRIAVPLFIMISGYLLLDSKKNSNINFYSRQIKTGFNSIAILVCILFLMEMVILEELVFSL
jgi:surface polysaccharide O-acyltransferase-like enzyme